MNSVEIKQRARDLGFDLCGIASAEPAAELGFLESWLARGHHGEMGYMVRTAERRLDPRRVLPSARSIIVLGTVYNTGRGSTVENTDPRAALISRYAWGDDYHDVLDARMARLEDWLRTAAGEGFESRRYVDTGPVVERVLAHNAGLGWIGKHTCLINPALGSWLFLSEILTSLDLAPDRAEVDRCGTCRLCIEACPTQALVDERQLDARRCISYLTIELKGSIPLELRNAIGRHIHGCDICQEVCPWNAPAAISDDPAWQPRPAFDAPGLPDLWRMSDAEVRSAITGTPLTRARVVRFRRNLAVALGNCGDPAVADVFDEPIDAPSMDDPLVREHIEWARQRLRRGDGGSA